MNMLTKRPGTVLNLLDGIHFPNLDFVWGGVDYDTKYPKVDIQEQKDAFVLEAELPGISEEDIEVEVDHSHLTIKVVNEQQGEKKEVSGKYILRERREASVERSFRLADNVDTEKVVASFKNGILQITVPKKEQERSKIIKIKAA